MKTLFAQARSAIDFLEQHQLEPDAVHYALALAHRSGANAGLTAEITLLVEGGVRLNADQAQTLIARYLTPQDPSRRPGIERELTAHATRLETLAGEAQGVALAVGDDVRHVVRHAEGVVPGGDAVVSRLTSAEEELIELKGQFEALKASIRSLAPESVGLEHDGLTSALNPVGARRIFEQVERHERRYVLLMFSIDGLVGINREFGASVGDNVLNAFANKLRKIFQDQEPIRWSGNEFVVVLPDHTVTAARGLAEEVLSLVERRKFRLLETGEWIGTVSGSASIVSDQGDDIDTLLTALRKKLVVAAQRGGNHVET